MSIFIAAQDLRASLGNSNRADDLVLDEACLIACGVVEQGWQEASGREPGVGPVLRTAGVIEQATPAGSRIQLAGVVLELTELTAFPAGGPLDIADFAVTGRDLWRKDGMPIPTRVQATYTAGWVNSDVDTDAPAWAKDTALAVAEQLFRRRFKLGLQMDGPVGFLVPALTRSLIAPYQPRSLEIA